MILNDTIKRGRNSHFIWTPQACRNDDLPERSRCRTLGLGKESQRGELEINADSRRAPLLGGRGGLFQSIVGEDPPNSRMWFMSGRVISDKMNKTSAGFHCGAELELIRPQPNPMSNNVSNTESTALTDEPENDAAVHSLLNATLLYLCLSIYLYYPSIYELLLQLIDQWIVRSFQSFNWCFHNACFLSANLKDDPFITTEATSERPGHANMGHKSVSKLVLCQSANWLSSLIDHLITQITAERCMTQTWTRSSTIKTHERCENTLHRFKENSCQSPASFVEKEPGVQNMIVSWPYQLVFVPWHNRVLWFVENANIYSGNWVVLVLHLNETRLSTGESWALLRTRSISGQSRSQGQEHMKVSDWYRRWSSHLHTKIEPVDCISTCWPQGVHCLRELHGSDITGSSLFCIHSPKASRTYCLVLILENKGSFYGRTTQ